MNVFKPFKRTNIGVVGLGLIGGSIAKALKQNLKGANIVGVDPSQDTLDLCMKDRVIDFGHKELAVLRGCEVVFVCTPIETVAETIKEVYGIIGDSAVITDVAGVKNQIFAALPQGIRFVSGHPMWGSEKSGYKNSDGAFAENGIYILIKEKDTADADFAAVKEMISSFTDKIVETDAKSHDEVLAAASHLPHILVYTLCNQALSDGGEAAAVAGRGFKDMTRVAQTQTPLWVNTCRLNADEVCRQIEEYSAALNSVKALIENKDWAALSEYFENGRELRLLMNDK